MYRFENFGWRDVLQHKEAGSQDGAMPNLSRMHFPWARFWVVSLHYVADHKLGGRGFEHYA